MKNKRVVVMAGCLVLAAGCIAGGWLYHNYQIEKAQKECIKKIQTAVSLDDYREAEQAEIKEIMDEYEKKVSAAEDAEEMEQFVSEASEAMGEIKTAAELTEEMRASGIKKLRKLADPDDYREAQRTGIEKIFEDAEKEISKAETSDEIEDIIGKAKSEIAEYRTDEQMTADEQAAAAARSRSSRSRSKGCVGNDASNFY